MLQEGNSEANGNGRLQQIDCETVNSEIFARNLISRNFAYAKFRESKPSQNAEIILLFTEIGRPYPCCEF